MWSLAGPAKEAALPGIIAPDAHVEFVFHLGEQWLAQRIGRPGWALQPAAFVYAASHGGLQLQPTGPVCLLAFRLSPVVATRILDRETVERLGCRGLELGALVQHPSLAVAWWLHCACESQVRTVGAFLASHAR